MNENEDDKFSPNVMIRKVRNPNQYLVYKKDELAIKGKVSTTREKENNGRYPYHSKIGNQEGERRNPSKKRMFLQKKDLLFQKERVGTHQGEKYLQGLLSLLLFHLNKSGMCCSIRNFPKAHQNSKNKVV